MDQPQIAKLLIRMHMNKKKQKNKYALITDQNFRLL